MLQVTNIEKSYGKQVLFDGVGFTVNPRERVGLVGRNGHGKSTLFRMILGEEHQDSGTITVPSGYTIGHLSQHIHFTEDTVLKEACLALPVNEDHIDESYKAEAILHGLGFTNDDFDRSPSSLSGGYQVRLNLAKVLVSEPNLLLLDEPTNYLDIVSVRWLTQFLRGWRNEMIIITHDREFMDSVTTHTMIIHRCKMRKVAGSTSKLYDQILMEEEIYEKTRQNDEKKRKEVEQFINRFRAQATKASAVQSRVKALARHEKLDKLEEIKNARLQVPVRSVRGQVAHDRGRPFLRVLQGRDETDRRALFRRKQKGPHRRDRKERQGQDHAPEPLGRGDVPYERRGQDAPEHQDRLLRPDQHQPSEAGQDRAPGGHGRAPGLRPGRVPRHLRAHDVRGRQRAQKSERALGRREEPRAARQAPGLAGEPA